MPLEGHWERQNTPLRRLTGRERRILAAAAGLIALATVVVVVLALTTSRAAPPPGCVDVTAASTTGAATFRACGEDAKARCAATDPARDGGLAQACRRAGLAVARP